MALQAGGTQISGQRVLPQNTTLAQEGGGISIVHTPGASGSLTYSLVLTHEGASTAGTVAVGAAATNPCSISVKGF
jgi:hypothetical protein